MMGAVRRAAASIPALLLLPLLTACGDDGASEPEVIGSTVADAPALTVVATDFAFEPNTIELVAGEPLNITLEVQEGGHDLAVPDVGFRIPILDEPDAAVATLVIDGPGTYSFSCLVPGHAAQGMVGTITVG